MLALHVASEVYPFSRTGGLADVMAALPRELSALGTGVTVVSPWYADLQGKPRELWREGPLRLGEIVHGGVRFLFLETPEFKRPGMYYPDDVQRFSLWSRALLYVLRSAGITFDVLHGHDWAAGNVVAHANLRGVKSLFTIHNLQYQGRWNAQEAFPWTGLPWETLTPEGVEFYGDVNLMKAGLVYAQHVTTVSPTYAREITTPLYGEGLEGVLQGKQRLGQLSGVVNGLDQDRWNPRQDPDVQPYGDYAGKKANIAALRAEFGLDDAPILACVSRLAVQKGLDILLTAMPEVVKRWNVLLLGSGDPALETAFDRWAKMSSRVRHVTGMQESLSHRLYAGAHAFAMPSRFEPCGLSQMIALRYGTLPVARATGGLADTVPREIGFIFEDATPAAFINALDEAASLLGQAREWQRRAERGMTLDFSWRGPAERYQALYRQVLGG